MQKKLDLGISHSEICLRSRPCTEDELQWGPGNRAQGLQYLPGLVLLDPISDEEYSATVMLKVDEKFLPNRQAKRTLQIPFEIVDADELTLSSPSDEIELDLDLEPGDYTLTYEVCLGSEVFYVLTLNKGKIEQATALKADGWGLQKDQALPTGSF